MEGNIKTTANPSVALGRLTVGLEKLEVQIERLHKNCAQVSIFQQEIEQACSVFNQWLENSRAITDSETWEEEEEDLMFI
mmetsp:Transcript_5302/g.6684  ORF Transcript_5302/g.6684 Transcript_5302/m.6684 type:complete len:80 (+) Transcript_5302:121-360(+)